MNSVFASRIAELRKERGISQKDAAAQLGVSQALLSHYENGIRECSLDFVCRASAYYDVSCDYLLGQIDARRSLDEEFDITDIAQDGEFRTGTLIRSAAMLYDSLTKMGSGVGDRIKNYYALSIYRIAVCAVESGNIPKEWISLNLDKAARLSFTIMSEFSDKSSFTDIPKNDSKNLTEPLCVKTIIEHSEQIIIKELQKFVPNEGNQ